ncbi:MAG: CdaR family protein [Clostridia bacterium]
MSEFIKKHDLINKVIAVSVAIILWAVVMNIKNPVMTKSYNDILVDFTSLSLIEDTYGLVMISDQFPTVDVKLKGNRDDFVQTDVTNIVVSADLSHIKEAGEYTIEYNVKTPYSNMEVTSKYPEYLTVIMDVMEIKEIPVEVEITGVPIPNYSYNEIQTSSTITVSGPHNELSKIEKAYTTVDVTDGASTISGTYDIVLLDAYGSEISSSNITQSTKTVDITLPVLHTVSVPLTVDLVYGDVVNAKRIEGYTLETTHVSIIGAPEYVDTINTIYLGEVNTDDTQYGKDEFIFGLPYMSNVSYVTGTSTSVTVTIDFTDYTTGYFDISNYIYDEEMLDENMIIKDESVEVAISGSNADLSALEPEDLMLEILIDREIIEITDEEGNITTMYAPLEPGIYEFPAILSVVSLADFDMTTEYTVSIEVLEME